MPDDPSAGGNALATDFPPVPSGRSADDLTQFWADYEPIVARAARSRLRHLNIPESLASPDDITQEVYLDVARHWATVEHPGKYALGCALRTVIRRIHRERLRQLGVMADDPYDQERLSQPVDVGPEDAVLDQLILAQLREVLPEAWEQLSDREQAAVELTILDGASRAEAAEAMGVATGTVSSHRTRGVVKLREALHETFLVRRLARGSNDRRALGAAGGLVVFAVAVVQFGPAVVLLTLAVAVIVLLAVADALTARGRRGPVGVLAPAVLVTLLCQGSSPAMYLALAGLIAVIVVAVLRWRKRRGRGRCR